MKRGARWIKQLQSCAGMDSPELPPRKGKKSKRDSDPANRKHDWGSNEFKLPSCQQYDSSYSDSSSDRAMNHHHARVSYGPRRAGWCRLKLLAHVRWLEISIISICRTDCAFCKCFYFHIPFCLSSGFLSLCSSVFILILFSSLLAGRTFRVMEPC